MSRRMIWICAWCIAAAPVATAAPKARPAEGRRQAIDLLAQGQSLEEQGDRQGAIACYQQSVQLAPSPSAYYHLGCLTAKAGQKAEARQYLEKSLELNPDYQLARMELGRLGSSKKTGADTLNVDAIQREYQTVHSLKNPVQAVAAAPSAPQNSATRADLAIPQAPKGPSTGAKARRSLEPTDSPQVIVNESNPVIISNGPDSVKPASGAPAGAATADGPRGKPAPAAEKPARGAATPAATRPADEAPAAPATGGAANTAAGGFPSAEEINRAAFGPDANAQKGSTVYGSDRKVFLGTFAFHKDKGDSYRAAERWVDAAQEYEQALKLKNDDAETRALYAEVLSRAGEKETAAANFARAEQAAPNDPKVFYRMGNIYREQKKPDLAIGAYRRAIQLDPNDKFAVNNLGVVYMEKGDYSNAVTQFRRVVELDPKYDKAVLNLGIIYDDHLANDELAAKYYQQYLQLGGDRANEVRRWLENLKPKAN